MTAGPKPPKRARHAEPQPPPGPVRHAAAAGAQARPATGGKKATKLQPVAAPVQLADDRFALDSDFLESEEEQQHAEQEYQQQAEGAGAGSRKRRAAPSGDEDDSDGGGGSGGSEEEEGEQEGAGTAGQQEQAQDGGEEGEGQADGKAKRKKVLTEKKLQRLREAHERRGIVYISRIPPHMKPAKLRQLLEPHGTLGRIYCAPEDARLRRLRKKKGGNTGKNFTEGWVEFEDKRRAKRAAALLNGQPMGGRKRSAYYYDLWALKYLPKFKWDQLTEEINYQRAVREQRLIAEISSAKRERDFYLSRVDQAKAVKAIDERRAAKQQGGAQPEGQARPGPGPSDAHEGAAAAAAAAPRAKVRHYGQRQAKADPVLDAAAPMMADDVLMGLMGRKKR